MTAATAMLRDVAPQDTVAYVPREGGPVDTSAYMWAGFAVTWIVCVLYVVLLFRRIARVRALPGGVDTGTRQ
jgi:hypothetical protein